MEKTTKSWSKEHFGFELSTIIVAAVIVAALSIPSSITGAAISNLPKSDANMIRPALLGLAVLAFVALKKAFN